MLHLTRPWLCPHFTHLHRSLYMNSHVKDRLSMFLLNLMLWGGVSLCIWAREREKESLLLDKLCDKPPHLTSAVTFRKHSLQNSVGSLDRITFVWSFPRSWLGLLFPCLCCWCLRWVQCFFFNLKSKEEDKKEKAISPLNKTGFEMSLFIFCYLNSGRCFSKWVVAII